MSKSWRRYSERQDAEQHHAGDREHRAPFEQRDEKVVGLFVFDVIHVRVAIGLDRVAGLVRHASLGVLVVVGPVLAEGVAAGNGRRCGRYPSPAAFSAPA